MPDTRKRRDTALDAALEMTFPASDPIAVYFPDPRDPAAGEAARGRMAPPVAEPPLSD